jgi:hypothetical protein
LPASVFPNQACGDLIELGRELGAEAINDRDDCHGDASGDQTVFDSGSPRRVFQKRCDLVITQLCPELALRAENVRQSLK